MTHTHKFVGWLGKKREKCIKNFELRSCHNTYAILCPLSLSRHHTWPYAEAEGDDPAHVYWKPGCPPGNSPVDFPKCLTARTVTCPCSRPIAGTRNGAQRLGKINQDSSPGRMSPTQGGRRWRPEQNWSSVRAEGGRGCLYQPTAGEDLTTHTVILENYSQTQSSDDSSSPFQI